MNDIAKLLTVTQTQEENPTVFLERSRESLIKNTALSPSSPMTDIILRDKFITQSAPDIQKKTAKIDSWTPGNPRSALRSCQADLYNWDQEESREQEKKLKSKSEALVAALHAIASSAP